MDVASRRNGNHHRPSAQICSRNTSHKRQRLPDDVRMRSQTIALPLDGQVDVGQHPRHTVVFHHKLEHRVADCRCHRTKNSQMPNCRSEVLREASDEVLRFALSLHVRSERLQPQCQTQSERPAGATHGDEPALAESPDQPSLQHDGHEHLPKILATNNWPASHRISRST